MDGQEIHCRYNKWAIAGAIILMVVCSHICRNHMLLCSSILNKTIYVTMVGIQGFDVKSIMFLIYTSIQ